MNRRLNNHTLNNHALEVQQAIQITGLMIKAQQSIMEERLRKTISLGAQLKALVDNQVALVHDRTNLVFRQPVKYSMISADKPQVQANGHCDTKVAAGSCDNCPGKVKAHCANVLKSLTEREVQVLKLVSEGQPNKQIAYSLDIAAKTVEKHRQSVMNKLGIHHTAGLTRVAIATRITSI